MSGAMALGLFVLYGLNLVDTYFISQLGLAHLAALGYAAPILFIFNAVLLSLSVGASTSIARKIGSGDDDGLQREVFQCLCLSVFLGTIFFVAIYSYLDEWVSLLGATGRTHDLACDYLSIALAGMLLLAIPTTGCGILRGSGNIRFMTQLMLGLCLVNLLLSPFLILGWGDWPGWGIEGAALAAVIPRAGGNIVTLVVLFRSEKLLRWVDLSLMGAKETWGKVLRIAAPSAFSNLIRPTVIGVVTVFLSRFGDEAISGFTLASRIEALVYVIFISLGGSLSTFVGQNYGARDFKRVRRCYGISFTFILVFGGLCSFICLTFPRALVSLFDTEPGVYRVAMAYLSLIALSYCAEGVRLVVSAGFYAMDRTVMSIASGALKVGLVYLGSVVAVTVWQSWWWVFWGVSLANIASGLLALCLLRYVTRKQLY